MNDTTEQPREYIGGAFHDSFDGGKSSGTIRISPTGLHFEAETGSADLLVEGLTIEAGGASNRMIFFQHPQRPGWCIYTSDKTILKEPLLTASLSNASQIQTIKKGNLRSHLLLITILVGIAASIFGLLQLRGPLTKVIARQIPPSWEQSLGDAAMTQFKLNQTIIADNELNSVLSKITSPLLTHIPDKRYEFKIIIIKDSSLNAFALPGGNIVIHSELLATVGSAEELLGVLAHEIAHVTQQHGIRQLISRAGLFLIIQALFGDSSGILTAIAENSAFLLNQKFSRTFEEEADQKAFIYLTEAHIYPMGLSDFFQRVLSERDKNKTLKVVGAMEDNLNFLSTHPSAHQRIQQLNSQWTHSNSPQKNLEYIDFQNDFKTLQEVIKLKIKIK